MGEFEEQVERLVLAGVGNDEVARTLGASRRRVQAARKRILKRWMTALQDREYILAQEVATLQFMRYMLWRIVFRTDSVSEQLHAFKLLLAIDERLLKVAQPREEQINGESQQLLQQVEALLQLLTQNGQGKKSC